MKLRFRRKPKEPIGVNDKEKRETVYNVINDNQKPLRYGLTRCTKERLAEMIVEALNKKRN